MPAVPRGRGPVDEKVIQERFQEFKSSFERRPYQRQKSALEQQLSTFLASVSPPKTISSCTVDDVIKCLTYKEFYKFIKAPLTRCLKSSGRASINLVASTTLILSHILVSRNT